MGWSLVHYVRERGLATRRSAVLGCGRGGGDCGGSLSRDGKVYPSALLPERNDARDGIWKYRYNPAASGPVAVCPRDNSAASHLSGWSDG